MDKILFHIDVNSAFLSWSCLKEHRPEALLVPSVVGGDPQNRRGIVLAKSPAAKAKGIVTGEPLQQALQKCPSLLIFPPDYDFYALCSRQLFQLLSAYSDRLEVFSIDECFLDYTGMERLFGPPLEAAKQIQTHIYQTLGFTVNIGIGPNKLLAKMAGELEKPNKIHTLFPEEIPQKLWPMPVEALFLVGKHTAPKLNRLGIFTIGDLAMADGALLKAELKKFGLVLKNYANGIADDTVSSEEKGTPPKSISHATTTPTDITTREDAHLVLLALAQTVSRRLRRQEQFATQLSVTLRDTSFHTYSHQRPLSSATNATKTIYEMALVVFDQMWKREPLRQLGISLGQLTRSPLCQLSLLEQDDLRHQKADAVADRLNQLFGAKTVQSAALLKPNPPKKRRFVE